MSEYTYKQILNKAKECVKNMKNYKTGVSDDWTYYFGKTVITPKKDVKKISMKQASNRQQDAISRGISKKDYTDIAKRYVAYVEKHKQIPNYVTYKNFKISPYFLKAFFAKIIVNNYPATQNINSKWFTKPSESENAVLDYFIKKFGKVSTIDQALGKVEDKGYGHYFDDQKSNKQTIDAMADSNHSNDPNCTDTCHVFVNVGRGLGYEVHVIHVKCNGGDGHVRLKLRHKKHTDNEWIYRDPACVVSQNGKGVRCNWCMDGTLLATDPSWFMQNLNR